MEYQKIINLLDNTPNQPPLFKTKTLVQKNGDSRGTCSTNSQTKYKTSMLRRSLCNYSDTYILVKETMTIPNAETGTSPNNAGKKKIFKQCALFTDCISKINNT